MCHPKNTSKLKTPSLLADPVIKPAPTVWSKTQGFRASIGFPFMRCSTLSWLHSKVLRFAQRGASFLWFLAPPATDSKALGIHGACSRFVFTNNAIQKQKDSPSFIKHFHGQILPWSQQIPSISLPNSEQKVSCFISNSCNCKFMLSYRCAWRKKKTWSSTRRGGSAHWSCCLDTNPSRGGQEQKSWSGTILHSNIWRFWTSCSKEMHVCWRSQNLRNHLSDIEATRILGSLAAFIWISASRPSISWCRWLEKKQLVTRHGAGYAMDQEL